MDQQIIDELLRLAREIDGVAEELCLLDPALNPKTIELFRIGLRLRRCIAALPE